MSSTVGRGSRLQEGEDAVLLAYGPVLLHEALLASERLAEQGIRLAVVNMPWLNYADPDWLTAEIAPYEHILVLDDHSPVGGARRHGAARSRRSPGHRLRGRGLARVRHAGGGPRLPPARRRLARAANRGAARRARMKTV